MPGNKKHHTDKWRSCVEKVMADGHDESSASAICTTSLQNAGQEIFRDAQDYDDIKVLEGSGPRSLHLL
ncbi:MAG TPA: hypothetical protein VJ837_05345, partial [Candidatus Paceibacterota bacterium]|nr:hypothetical protein [Candidatus Paceibacterota bacterium]